MHLKHCRWYTAPNARTNAPCIAFPHAAHGLVNPTRQLVQLKIKPKRSRVPQGQRQGERMPSLAPNEDPSSIQSAPPMSPHSPDHRRSHGPTWQIAAHSASCTAPSNSSRADARVRKKGGAYVEATLLLVCVVVEAPPRWLPPGVGGSEFSDESECTLRGRLGDRSE